MSDGRENFKNWSLLRGDQSLDATHAPSSLASTAESPSSLDSLAAFRTKLNNDSSDVGLAHKAGILAQAFQGRLPTAAELQNITEELGLDLATAVYLRTLQDSQVHGVFARRLRAMDFRGWDAVSARAAKIEVAVIASNLFQSGRKWGDHVEDWRAWARDLGFTTDVIETNPRFSVAANARLIFEYLARTPNRRRIVVSYGQGSSEFRYLLHRRVHRDEADPMPEEVEQICGWINVCGSFAGSSSSRYFQENRIRRLLARLRLKVAGRNLITLAETSSQFPLWRRPLPHIPSLEIASIVAVPQRGQVPVGLLPMFNELGKTVPNDGAVSIVEASAHPGAIVAVPGLSHRAEKILLEPVFKRTLALISQRLVGLGTESADLVIDSEHKRK